MLPEGNDHSTYTIWYTSSALQGTAPTLARTLGLPTVFAQAPFRWRHADLAQIKAFLKAKIQDGSYKPFLEGGLD